MSGRGREVAQRFHAFACREVGSARRGAELRKEFTESLVYLADIASGRANTRASASSNVRWSCGVLGCEAISELVRELAADRQHRPPPVYVERNSRRAAGRGPTIGGPSRFELRPVLFANEKFRWATPRFIPEPGPMGTLDDVPVYAVAPEQADYMVVANTAGSLELTQYLDPDATSALHVEIHPIDEERAAELLDRKYFSRGEHTREEAIRLLSKARSK